MNSGERKRMCFKIIILKILPKKVLVLWELEILMNIFEVKQFLFENWGSPPSQLKIFGNL